MRSLKVFGIILLLVMFVASCGPLPENITINVVEPTQDVNAIVKATFGAMTQQATSLNTPTPISVKSASSPTPMPAASSLSTGEISGSLNYPASSIPAMFVVAYLAGSQTYQFVITNPGQGTYQIENLQPGVYHVIAYTVGGGGFPVGLAGGYTKAVICGLSSACTDHSLIDIVVSAGKTATGVSPYDWYAPQGTFVPFPQISRAVTNVPAPSPAVANGSISGELMYPAGGIPALRIVATEVETSNYYHIDTALGQTSYQLDQLPPGTYHVVAYVLPGGGFTAGLSGGYSQMVTCGLASTCKDHTLIDVIVTSNHVTTGVDPNDFYADSGAFPPNPIP